MSNLEFITECTNKGITLKNIHNSGLSTLDILKFLKLGGEKYLNKKPQTLKQKYLNQKMPDKTIELIDTIYGFFDKIKENDVIKNFIVKVGEVTNDSLFEGLIVKKAPYSYNYIFNIIFENGSIDMLENKLHKDYTTAKIIRTEGFPTKEQLVCMIISPDKIKKSNYTDDFGVKECFNTDFNTESIYESI